MIFEDLIAAQERIFSALRLTDEWESMGCIDNAAAARMRYVLGELSREEYEAILRAAQDHVPDGGGMW